MRLPKNESLSGPAHNQTFTNASCVIMVFQERDGEAIIMWTILRAMSFSSTKIVLTFIVAIFLIILSLLFYPTAYLGMSDLANWLANLDWIRNPSDDQHSTAVVRLLVSETTIFGVVTTLVARMVVEILWFTTALLWRLANPKSEPQSGDAAHQYYAES